MNQKPLTSLLTTCAAVLLLFTWTGCDVGSMNKTINFGQGNVIQSSGTKTTANLEGMTLEILHPGVNTITAKNFILSSVPQGREIKVYELQLGTQLIQLSGTNNALFLTVNQQAHGPIQTGSMIKVDQDGTVTVIKTAPGQVPND